MLKLLVSARGLGEEQLYERLHPHMPDSVETTASGISFVEITGRGVHKAKALQDALVRHLEELRHLTPDKLVRRRREKFLRMGEFTE